AVSRSWSSMGLAAIGSSSTGWPPSEDWTLGRAQGVGEQVSVPDAAARAADVPPGFTWPAWTARAARTPPDNGLRGRWKRLPALPAAPAPAESVGSAARAPTRSRLRKTIGRRANALPPLRGAGGSHGTPRSARHPTGGR